MSELFPRSFRIGKGSEIIGVYREDEYDRALHPHELVCFLYSEDGVMTYLPNGEEVLNKLSITTEDLSSNNSLTLWRELLDRVDRGLLDEKETLAYEFACRLLSKEEDPMSFSYGLAVVRALSLSHRLRNISDLEKTSHPS